MSKEKQIEGMAKKLKAYCYDIKLNDIDDCRRLADFIIDTLGYRKQSEWISVEERLPEESGWYLVNIFVPFCLDFMNLSHYSKGYGWNNPATVTHWMPLPEPPKMEGGEE